MEISWQFTKSPKLNSLPIFNLVTNVQLHIKAPLAVKCSPIMVIFGKYQQHVMLLRDHTHLSKQFESFLSRVIPTFSINSVRADILHEQNNFKKPTTQYKAGVRKVIMIIIKPVRDEM